MFMEKKRAFQMRKETEESMTEQSIPPNMYLGHVHLKVANLERALTFYLEVMGLKTRVFPTSCDGNTLE